MPRPRRTIDEVSPPLVGRLVNLWGHSLERLGLPPKHLEAGSLRRAAEAATGLRDRGGAVRFDPLLDQLLESAGSEARLAPFGRVLLRQECVSVLSQQLLAQELFRCHPEVLAIPVRKPLFIVGFFRSGTTLVQRLLGNHADARNLRTWEALRPIPQGLSPLDGGEDRRIQEAERDLGVLRAFVPPRVHELETQAAEESVFLLRHAFSSLLQWGLFGSRGFLRRLLEQKSRPAYDYLRSQLQVLEWQGPGGRWILKSGQHLLDLDDIAEVFPDAGFVWTHRDPADLVPSYLSLVACIRQGTNARPVDLPDLAEECLEMIDATLTRAMASELVQHSDRILHVPYRHLVDDPVGTAERILDRYEMPVDNDTAQRLRAWTAAHPRDRWGRHVYDLEPFGLEIEDVRSRYAEYASRFMTREA